MRIGASALLALTALFISSCGASHLAVTSRAVTSHPNSSSAVLISARSGAVRYVTGLSRFTAVADGRGGWFIASDKSGLARLRPDGTIDPSWGTRESRHLRGVSLLIKSGSRLYVSVFSGHRHERVEAFEVEKGIRLWGVWDVRPGARLWVSPPVVTPVEGTDAIYALAASSTRVYVGGAFTRVGGIHRQGLAALDAKTGRLLDWRTPPIHWEPSPEIDALALTGSRLYVGGALDSIGGQPRLSIAALDAGTGALLPWNPNPPVGDASTILVTHGEVITADFDGFAATSVRTGHRLSWTWRNGGEASTFVADWPLVYFAEELGPMGAFNLATGRVTNWYPDILFLNVSVSKIVPSGGQVLVLGEFTDWIG